MNGLVNINKLPGFTSNDIVAIARGIIYKYYGSRNIKVGHNGTLDPAASGVLTICYGSATKLFNYNLNFKKKYRAGIQFGTKTDSADAQGTIIEKNDRKITLEEVEKVINNFIGTISQAPHKYSSVKIDGKKAYELARSNVDFSIKKRNVDILSIEIISLENNLLTIDVECKKGTYIRVLAEDIANSLRTVAYLSFLVRMQDGNFDINNSVTLQEFSANPERYLIDINDYLSNIKVIDFNRIDYKKYVNGIKFPLEYQDDYYLIKNNDKKTSDVKNISLIKIKNKRIVSRINFNSQSIYKKIILNKNEIKAKSTVIALGYFDSLHKGHIKLLNYTKKLAIDGNKNSSLFTFSTGIYLDINKRQELFDINNRIERYKQTRINECYLVNPSRYFLKKTGEWFIKDIITKLQISDICIGKDYKCGCDHIGYKEIIKIAESMNVKTHVLALEKINDTVISTTLIKQLLQNGDIEHANQLLSKRYSIINKVVEGNKIGRQHDIPTANITFEDSIFKIKYGVYLTKLNYKNNSVYAITNVGTRPTFNDDKFIVETNMIDSPDLTLTPQEKIFISNANLYNKNIEIEFIKFIRETHKFSNSKELYKQIREDIFNCIKYIKSSTIHAKNI